MISTTTAAIFAATLLLTGPTLTATDNPWALEENHLTITVAGDEQTAYFTHTLTFDKEDWLTNWADDRVEDFEVKLSRAEAGYYKAYDWRGMGDLHKVETTHTADRVSFRLTSKSYPLDTLNITVADNLLTLNLNHESVFGGLRDTWGDYQNATLTLTHKSKNLNHNASTGNGTNKIVWDQSALTNTGEELTIHMTGAGQNPDPNNNQQGNTIDDNMWLFASIGGVALLIVAGIITLIILRRKAESQN